MLDAGENSSSSSAAVSGECLMTSRSSTSPISKRTNSKNKRRFSDDQVRLLETMFETETKLEPKKKLQLARELGLQPRQVAIWFQNKRARWKSKQLERDYNLLSTSYNNLASQFESLEEEKQSLLVQLQKLNDFIDKSEKVERDHCCRREAPDAETAVDNVGRRVSIGNDPGNIESTEFDVKPSLSPETSEYRVIGQVFSDDESSRNPDYIGLGEEPAELLNIVEPAGSSLTSPEEWGSLDSEVLLDKPSSSYCQWSDFWS